MNIVHTLIMPHPRQINKKLNAVQKGFVQRLGDRPDWNQFTKETIEKTGKPVAARIAAA